MPFLAKIGAALKGAAVKAAKAKATEKAIETAQDENARNMLLLSGCGCFAAFLFFPIFIFLFLFNEFFGTIQLADGAEIGGGSANVQLGEAASYKTEKEKIKFLYGSNGVPMTSAENEKYLETFPVEYLDKNGKEKTIDMTMHKKLKTEVQAIFREMMEINFKLEWESGGGSIRAWGTDQGYSGTFYHSAHCYGHAVDINVNANPCIGSCGHVGGTYSPGKDPYSVTEKVVNIWKQHGFYWGGDWSDPKDYMHFSYFNH